MSEWNFAAFNSTGSPPPLYQTCNEALNNDTACSVELIKYCSAFLYDLREYCLDRVLFPDNDPKVCKELLRANLTEDYCSLPHPLLFPLDCRYCDKISWPNAFLAASVLFSMCFFVFLALIKKNIQDNNGRRRYLDEDRRNVEVHDSFSWSSMFPSMILSAVLSVVTAGVVKVELDNGSKNGTIFQESNPEDVLYANYAAVISAFVVFGFAICLVECALCRLNACPQSSDQISQSTGNSVVDGPRLHPGLI